jgi:hypothetical protein
MKDHISRAEIRKDALQDSVETTATAVGAVTTIVTTAVRDVARTLGGLATEPSCLLSGPVLYGRP